MIEGLSQIMTFKSYPYMKYDYNRDFLKTERTKDSGHTEGDICEQFAYLPDLAVYPNCLDMNKLSEIRLGGFTNKKEVIKYEE